MQYKPEKAEYEIMDADVEGEHDVPKVYSVPEDQVGLYQVEDFFHGLTAFTDICNACARFLTAL